MNRVSTKQKIFVGCVVVIVGVVVYMYIVLVEKSNKKFQYSTTTGTSNL